MLQRCFILRVYQLESTAGCPMICPLTKQPHDTSTQAQFTHGLSPGTANKWFVLANKRFVVDNHAETEKSEWVDETLGDVTLADGTLVDITLVERTLVDVTLADGLLVDVTAVRERVKACF
jgi:hypothetical protein